MSESQKRANEDKRKGQCNYDYILLKFLNDKRLGTKCLIFPSDQGDFAYLNGVYTERPSPVEP